MRMSRKQLDALADYMSAMIADRIAEYAGLGNEKYPSFYASRIELERVLLRVDDQLPAAKQ